MSAETANSPPLAPLRRLLAIAEQLERLILALLLSAMILLACYQIGLRWFTSGGEIWIDPLLRHLVLWGGLFGAVYATSRGRHISLNLTDYLAGKAIKPWFKIAAGVISTLVCVFLFRASLLFTGSEIEFGGPGLFGLPTWIWYLIFPIAFGLMTLHFAAETVLTAADLRAGRQPQRAEPWQQD